MSEQKVFKNEVKEYFLVKVNDLFLQGKESLVDSIPVKLYRGERDATRFDSVEEAQEMARLVSGSVVKVIDTEIHTRKYETV